MTQDIIEMARQAGFTDTDLGMGRADILKDFAKLVAADAAAKEREECAKVCEEDAFVEQWKGLAEAAKRIRERGQQ